MPVTQRWVHGGLVLVAGILSISLTVLVLGASRPTISDSGLVGSIAPVFTLRDGSGGWVNLKECRDRVVVMIVGPAHSPVLDRQGKQVEQLIDTFSNDTDIQFLGVAFDPQAGMLAPTSPDATMIGTALASLHTLRDVDGSVARAYRVVSTPVLFIIDTTGVIRARLPLDGDGAIVAASETITSLRKAQPTMPMFPTDGKMS